MFGADKDASSHVNDSSHDSKEGMTGNVDIYVNYDTGF